MTLEDTILNIDYISGITIQQRGVSFYVVAFTCFPSIDGEDQDREWDLFCYSSYEKAKEMLATIYGWKLG